MFLRGVRTSLSHGPAFPGRTAIGLAYEVLPNLRAYVTFHGGVWGAPDPWAAAIGSTLVGALGAALYAGASARLSHAAAFLLALPAGAAIVALAGMAEDLGFGMAPTLFQPGYMAHVFHVRELLFGAPVLGICLGAALVIARRQTRTW